MSKIKYAVFTKPWKSQTLDELGALVRDMGFDAVEYPLRGGYQVEPKDGRDGIKRLVETLAKYDVKVASLAAGIDVHVENDEGKVVGASEDLVKACGEFGIPMIRICQGYNKEKDFWSNIKDLQQKYSVIETLGVQHGVSLGVQMHHGDGLIASYDSYILLKDFDKRGVSAVWDAGHSGLAGEHPTFALDVLWEHLGMVNFKSAYWFRGNGPEAEQADWHVYWTTGRNGMCPWDVAIAHLKKRGYEGYVCLPAEYSDGDLSHVEQFTREDLIYIKELFAK